MKRTKASSTTTTKPVDTETVEPEAKKRKMTFRETTEAACKAGQLDTLHGLVRNTDLFTDDDKIYLPRPDFERCLYAACRQGHLLMVDELLTLKKQWIFSSLVPDSKYLISALRSDHVDLARHLVSRWKFPVTKNVVWGVADYCDTETVKWLLHTLGEWDRKTFVLDFACLINCLKKTKWETLDMFVKQGVELIIETDLFRQILCNDTECPLPGCVLADPELVGKHNRGETEGPKWIHDSGEIIGPGDYQKRLDKNCLVRLEWLWKHCDQKKMNKDMGSGNKSFGKLFLSSTKETRPTVWTWLADHGFTQLDYRDSLEQAVREADVCQLKQLYEAKPARFKRMIMKEAVAYGKLEVLNWWWQKINNKDDEAAFDSNQDMAIQCIKCQTYKVLEWLHQRKVLCIRLTSFMAASEGRKESVKMLNWLWDRVDQADIAKAITSFNASTRTFLGHYPDPKNPEWLPILAWLAEHDIKHTKDEESDEESPPESAE